MSDTTLAYKTTLDASGFANGAQNINSHLHQMGINTSAASANLGGLGTLLGTLANPLTLVALGITAIGGALVGSAQAAAAWETSMTGVAKTTGLAGPELQKLSQDLLQMSTTVPLAASELASIAAAGGSLGIAGDQLAGFTEVAAQMGVGFEMSADQAATAGAKILNAFGKEMSVDNLRSLGSVVNTMGDSFAATEPQVLEFLNRASFLNATMGQSIPQVAALGTTLISTGLEAEVAATGIKSMLNMLTSETSKTGGMDNWAKLMGTSVDELKQKVATDLNSTLIETANKIAAIEDPVERFQAAVTAAGSEGAPALLKLAGQQDNYTKALGLTNSEWEKASSLQKTFDAQAGTVNSQWQMFMNTLTMAGTEFGTVLLPALASALGFMTDLAKIGMKVGETLSSVVSSGVDMLQNDRLQAVASGINDASSSIWGGVKDWAGIGTEHADQMAKEIAESDKLQKAGAEGLQAGIDAGVLKDPAKNAANEFSKEFVEAFKTAQADREIAKVLARAGNAALTTDKGNVAGTATTTLENGLEVEVAYQGNDRGIYSRLFIDGQQIGDGVYGANREAVLSTLLSKWKYDQANILDLTGRTGEAAVLRAEQKVEFQFDYTGISAIFGDQFVSRLENEGGRIATSASKTVQDAYQSLLDALKEPTWDNLDEVLDQMDSLIAEHEIDPSEAALWATRYKETLVAGIVDIGEFAKDKAASSGDTISKAFEDHFLDIDERKAIAALDPMLETIKAESPEAFGDAGLASIEKFVEMAKNGASSEELYAYFREMGLKSGEEFTEFNTTAFKELDFSEWIKAPNWDNILNPSDYIANVFQPKVLDAATTALKDLSTGEDAAYNSGNELVMSMKEIAAVMPELFTPEQQQALKNYDGNLLKLSDTLEILSAKTEENTSKMKEYKEALVWDPSSLFGQWQESSESGVFFDSYIGASYGTNFENYLKRLAEQKSSVADSAERLAAAHRGEYIAPGVADLSLDIDTTQADTKLQNVETNINKIIELTSKPQYLEIQFVGNKTLTETTAQAAGSDAIEVNISTVEADLKLNSVNQLLSDIQTAADPISVTADTIAAHKELDDLMADIAALRPKVKVEVDITANAADIQLLAEEAVSAAIRNAQV